MNFDFRKGFKINVDKDELLRFASQHSIMVKLDFGRFIQVTVDAISNERTNKRSKISRFMGLLGDDDDWHEY